MRESRPSGGICSKRRSSSSTILKIRWRKSKSWPKSKYVLATVVPLILDQPPLHPPHTCIHVHPITSLARFFQAVRLAFALKCSKPELRAGGRCAGKAAGTGNARRAHWALESCFGGRLCADVGSPRLQSRWRVRYPLGRHGLRIFQLLAQTFNTPPLQQERARGDMLLSALV